jgi:hypothetical protein
MSFTSKDCPFLCALSKDCSHCCDPNHRCKLPKLSVESLPPRKMESFDTMRVDLSYLNSLPAGSLASDESDQPRTVYGRNQRAIEQSLMRYTEPNNEKPTLKLGTPYWTSLTLIGLSCALLLSALSPHIPLSIDLYHLPLLGSTRMHSLEQP